MLRSMTGFGSGSATVGTESVSIELKSVNHKFCEVKVRLPRELNALEGSLQKVIKDRLARGSVDVTVKRANRTGGALVPTVDLSLAQEYRKAFADLARALSVPDQTTVRDVASQQGVVRLEEPQANPADAAAATEAAIATALDALLAMRAKEGVALHTDLSTRLEGCAVVAQEIRGLAPAAVDEYRARLAERVAELTRSATVDAQRLVQEVAIFAERTDVAEEMTRLASHFEQFRALLASAEPAGRKLDFLVQEMHREVNTTGSKSQHAGISSRIVHLKAELERIREQVQNVE